MAHMLLWPSQSGSAGSEQIEDELRLDLGEGVRTLDVDERDELAGEAGRSRSSTCTISNIDALDGERRFRMPSSMVTVV